MKRKKFELGIQYRLALFVAFLLAALVLCAEAFIQEMAQIYANEIRWRLVVAGIFLIIALLIGHGLSEDLRKFFKKGVKF